MDEGGGGVTGLDGLADTETTVEEFSASPAMRVEKFNADTESTVAGSHDESTASTNGAGASFLSALASTEAEPLDHAAIAAAAVVACAQSQSSPSAMKAGWNRVNTRVNKVKLQTLSMAKEVADQTRRPESLDFDVSEMKLLQAVAALPDHTRQRLLRRQRVLSWLLIVSIGLVVGCIGTALTQAVEALTHLKWGWVNGAIAGGAIGDGWLWLVLYCTVAALIAACLCLLSPQAAGSGIPHVKSYLNGNELPGVLELRTLIVKVVGICLMVSCGVPVGREGPMVHAGAVVAAELSRFWAHLATWGLPVPRGAAGFDNDRDRRNFVSMGAAAGVAAAFNAPIGGILFSLEEVSSFWDPQLTWTTFIAAAIAAFTVNMWASVGHSDDGVIKDSGLVTFAGCGGGSEYALFEVLIFVLIGAACGFLGAAFNTLNRRLTLLRRRHVGIRAKAPEAVLAVCLVVSLFFWVCLPFACEEAPPFADDEGIHLASLECDGGSLSGHRRLEGGGVARQYNPMATLLLQGQEEAIKQLFSRGTAGLFPLATLACFVPIYFAASVFIYGIAVPSGLFVPCMMIGAGVGRLSGELMHLVGYEQADPGLYALVGAAGMLGGVTRMTISLTVILVEVSNDINLLLPLVIAILVAKVIGDRFTHSLYDIHIELTGAVLLESSPAPESRAFLLPAKAIMSRKLRCVREVETVGFIRELLSRTYHHGYPVVDDGGSGTERGFAGLISRASLAAVVETAKARGKSSSTEVDLRTHCDQTPYCVHELLPLYRVCRLFQSMGLRHLCVLDARSSVVGIITRKDFAKWTHSSTAPAPVAYAHLNPTDARGSIVQQRMLVATHQVQQLQMREGRRLSIPGAGSTRRAVSDPDLLKTSHSRHLEGDEGLKEQLSFMSNPSRKLNNNGETQRRSSTAGERVQSVLGRLHSSSRRDNRVAPAADSQGQAQSQEVPMQAAARLRVRRVSI